jgi:hypothetical protein
MRTVLFAFLLAVALAQPALAHGGGLNACGCHFNRKTGECHCHRPRTCGCACEPPECAHKLGVEALGDGPGGGDIPGMEPPVAPSPQRPAAARGARPLPGTCGVERWNVKTLVDAPTLASKQAQVSTIAALGALPPVVPWQSVTPRTAAERQVVGVTAWIVGYKLEADSDWHVVIQDAAGQTMIVEFPDPACSPKAVGPVFAKARAQFLALVPAAPTQTLHRLAQPVPVSVAGVVFLDKIHGQTGVAPNGVELHPVTWISKRRAP